MRIALSALVAVVIALVASGSIASEQRPELVIYDVTDLTSEPQDFPGYEMTMSQPQAQVCCFGGGGRAAGAPTCASIAEMIKTRVRPEMWDPATGVSIEEKGGMLVIMQTGEIHQQISALFEKFREQGKAQVVVKGLLIPSNDIPRETYFNADGLTKLLGPGGMSNVYAAPRIVCCNGQRTHVRCTRDFGHISTHEISGDMLDPVVRNLVQGCVFDVRPMLSHDRRVNTVELRCYLTSAADTSEKRKISFAPPVSVRNAKGAKTPTSAAFDIDTTSVQLGSVRTSLRIPDGKWMLAGTIPNPDAAAKEKHILVLVSLETLSKNNSAALAKIDPAPAKVPAQPKLPPIKLPKDPGPLELRIFDIRDMTTVPTDFPAPRADFSIRNQQAGASVDPFAVAAVASGLADTDIASFIKEKALADFFENPETTVDVSNGKLVVMQRAAVHERIAVLLDAWREMLMPQIVVRSRLIASNDLPDATYLDEDAVNGIIKKEGNVTVAEYRCLAFNKQRTHARNGREFTYIRDYDVSGETYDPIVAGGFEGNIFEVRPTKVTDGSAIQLDIGFGLSSDVARTKRTLGIPAAAGATATASIGGFSSDSSEKKYQIPPPAANAPPKTEKDLVEERTSNVSQTSAGLLNGKFISGCELDSIALNVREMSTQLVVPKNKWVLAGVMSNPNPKGPKHLLLFVTAEVLEMPK